jgi:hypothetical protein
VASGTSEQQEENRMIFPKATFTLDGIWRHLLVEWLTRLTYNPKSVSERDVRPTSLYLHMFTSAAWKPWTTKGNVRK